MKVKDYKELDVWKNGVSLVLLVYEATRSFPGHERYCLVQHLRKTAISIPSNIAEGFSRNTSREFRQFCRIALGSCAELDTQVAIARELGYLKRENDSDISEKLNHESRVLMNLIKRLGERAS